MAIKPIELIIKARDEASGVLGTLQGKLTAVAATIAAYFGFTAFAGAVKGAADLEAGMSRVLAATGASTAEMKLLRQAAEDAGANSKYTSTEAAGALETLAKAGLNAKDAIAALPAVLDLAQAGDIELGTASEYLTKAVMGMGLAFTDANRVADVLAMGANATNTSVTGLAQALSYVAPIANTLGVSLESTVAIVGKFADAGIDASRAGTALNGIMSQFADPASKFRQELGAAGITTNNFEAALHQLAKAGPSGSKAINAVGLEAGPALRALLNQGMGALDDLTTKLKSAEGSAAATAKVMQDNLNGSISGLSSAWDTVKNALATPVLPVLKDGVDQLAGAFRSAVADGTIAKFGDAIAVGFQSGIKWVRAFIVQVDFGQVTANMRAFADRTGEVFTQIGEYATNAGNIVKLGYGVMSAGGNAVLVVIYGIGSGFATVASTIMSGVAILREGLAKVTFGGLSDSFKLAAEDARNAAQGFGDAAQAMRDKAAQALGATADSARLARDGFTGLTLAVTDGKPAIDGASGAMANMAKELTAGAEAAAAAGLAYQKKANAEQIAKQASDTHALAVRTLKDEYGALIASGNLQGAAEKLKEVNAALQATPAASKDSVKAAQEAAQAIADAFQRLGVTSTADLKLQADNALRDYNLIKAAGTSTAQDLTAAFKAYADKAIEANNGVATETIKSQAAMRGYELQVDSAGKTTLRATGEGVNGVDGLAGAYQKMSDAAVSASDRAVSALEKQNAAQERLNAATDKAIELEMKRQKVDKEGFSTDKDNKRIVMGTDVGTLTGIAAFLKAAGVDDDAQARKLALEFADGKGNIPYIENAGQKKYGGETMSMALLKAAETYTFGIGKGGAKSPSTIPKPEETVQQANQRQNGGTTDAGSKEGQTKYNAEQGAKSAAQSAAEEEARLAAQRNAAVVNTYTTNVTIESKTRQINTTDAASSSALQEVLRELAAARSTAAR